jgi:hypothetical protein
VLGGGGFLFKTVFLSSLDERRDTIARLQKEIDEKEDKIFQYQRQKTVLDTARQLSLPGDIDLDRREYQRYLEDLLRQSGFPAGFRVTSENPDTTSSPKLPGKKEPIYTALPFKVTAQHGTLPNLIEAMERFYQTGFLHRIKSIRIQRPLTMTGPQGQQPTGELDMDLTIEALVLSGVDSRNYLLPNVSRRLLVIDVLTAMRGGPSGLALVPWAAGPAGPLGPHKQTEPPRHYEAIAGKNIFFGPQIFAERKGEEIEYSRYVRLVHTERSDGRLQAFLYDRYNNKHTRLRPSPGFDQFRVVDDDGKELMKGKVVQIDLRDVIFRSGENYYRLHVGVDLADAMDTPLSADQLRSLGIVEAEPKKGGAGQ